MEKMQFSAAVLMTLLALTLALLPRRSDSNQVPYRSRWFMVVGIGLLALHFAVQVKLGLRSRGVPQAVMLNLFMFVPASWMLNLGLLHLQRKGNLLLREWLVGIIAWVVVSGLLLAALYFDREPVTFNGLELPMEEIIGSVVYLAMQCHT